MTDRLEARRAATDLLAVGTGAITVAAMIATPLLPCGGPGRRRLTSVVVTGLAGLTASRVSRQWGLYRTAVAAAVIAPATLAVERIGTRTGLPFGRYTYTGVLRPRFAGVPMIVPLAWFAMAPPARETAHRALGRRSAPPARLALGAAALTAWDLFLDPQMVGEGYWRWARRGRYRGIPATNYLGWFLVGLAIMAALEKLLPADHDDAPARRMLVGEYAYMAAMETVGFGLFFRDPLVAAVGGAAMLPLAVAGLGGQPGG